MRLRARDAYNHLFFQILEALRGATEAENIQKATAGGLKGPFLEAERPFRPGAAL